MSRTVFRRFWLIVFVFCLASSGLAQNQPPRPSTTATAVEEFAAALVAAKTDEERTTLLAAKKELQTLELVQALHRQGDLLRKRDSYWALIPLRLSQNIAEQIGEEAELAGVLITIGDTYRGQDGKAGLALEHFQKSLALREKLGDQASIAQTLRKIGLFSQAIGNFRLALWYFRKAIAFYENLGNKEMSNATLNSIGYLYSKMGYYDLALECLEKSLSQAGALGHKSQSSLALRHLAAVYARQGRSDLALQHQLKSLMLSEESGKECNVADDLRELGKLESAQGNYASAIVYYQKSLAACNYPGFMETTLAALADTYRLQGNYHSALQFAERAVRMPFGYTVSHIGHSIAGKAYRALSQLDQSEAAFYKAIMRIEDIRAYSGGGHQEVQHLFEEMISPYHEMVGLLVAQRKPGTALVYAENSKARTLLDVLQNARANVVKAITSKELSQERRLKNDLSLVNAELLRVQQRQPADPARLSDLQKRQQKAQEAFEAFQEGLHTIYPKLKKRTSHPFLRSKEIAALLPDTRTALLEFVVTEEQTLLFVMTRSSVRRSPVIELKVYPLATTAKDLGAQVEAFRQQLAKRNPEFGAAASELYDLLLKPAAAQMQGKTSLVIVPDGSLWELPFQALQLSSNRFLIEDCAISYAPSLTALNEMTKARKRRSGSQPALLALGNPALGQETASRAEYVLMSEKFDPLPEAEVQVKTLGRLYGPQQSKIYTGAEAREERAKAEAGRYRILHLATHGVLNDASPMYSHLLLSQTNEPGKDAQEDGLLEAWELMKLELNADLVVLSACETARGRIGAGEGVIGLTWALFVAGCPRTVVSQWKVESASTTELMVEFHRHLKTRMQNPKSSFGAAQSLRASALKMLRSEKYRHPFWWAGFVVVGDGS